MPENGIRYAWVRAHFLLLCNVWCVGFIMHFEELVGSGVLIRVSRVYTCMLVLVLVIVHVHHGDAHPGGWRDWN